MSPHSEAAEAYVRTSQRMCKLGKLLSPHLFSFSSHLRLLHTFLAVHWFPQDFPFHQVVTINHDLHPHLRGFTPLRKILTVNHCLRSPHFEQSLTVPGLPPPILNTHCSPCRACRPALWHFDRQGWTTSCRPAPSKALGSPPARSRRALDAWEH